MLCRGDKGLPNKPVANLARVRRNEAAAAARILGATAFFGGYPDGRLADGPAERLKLMEIYRQFNPTLVLAHAQEDYHPDHQAASALAEAASWFCASRAHATRSTAMKSPPALWWMDTIGMSGFTPGFFVDITEQMAIKGKMLGCHHTQLSRARNTDFSSLVELMHSQYKARGLQAGVTAAEAFRAHHAFKRARAW
jgi:LmbE family N-acetylglucosaminyl deacetylase